MVWVSALLVQVACVVVCMVFRLFVIVCGFERWCGVVFIGVGFGWFVIDCAWCLLSGCLLIVLFLLLKVIVLWLC